VTSPEALTAVLGGFPSGGFRSPVVDLCDRVVSIHETRLNASTVASEILVGYRTVANPQTCGHRSPT
jgi:rRNA pseudouridine-1189 N-methylase Emg1 (Nep1/Mra1 family)